MTDIANLIKITASYFFSRDFMLFKKLMQNLKVEFYHCNLGMYLVIKFKFFY